MFVNETKKIMKMFAGGSGSAEAGKQLDMALPDDEN